MADCYCPECKTRKDQTEMTTLPTSKNNVIRRCCKACRKRIMGIRKGIKKVQPQGVKHATQPA